MALQRCDGGRTGTGHRRSPPPAARARIQMSAPMRARRSKEPKKTDLESAAHHADQSGNGAFLNIRESARSWAPMADRGLVAAGSRPRSGAYSARNTG